MVQILRIILSVIFDRKGEGRSLMNIGLIYKEEGDLDKALEYLKEALAIHQEIDHPLGAASSLSNIGAIYEDKGDLDEALKLLQKAKSIFETIGAKSQLQTVNKKIMSIRESKE